MSSEKRGGLSKREYKAKQTGGVLNYKTGRITAPVKARKPAVQRPAAANPFSGMPEGAIGQSADGGFIMPDGSTKYAASSATNPQAMNYQPQYSPAKNYSEDPSAATRKRSSSRVESGEIPQASQEQNFSPAPVSSAPPVGQGGSGLLSDFFRANAGYSQGGVSAASYAGMSRDIPMEQKLANRDQLKTGADWLFGVPTAYASDDPLAREGFNRKPATSDALDPGLTQDVVTPDVDENADVWGETGPTTQALTGGDFSDSSSLGKTGAAAKPVKPEVTDAEKYFRQLKEQSEDAFQQMLDSLSPTYSGYKDEFESELQKALMEERNALLSRQMAYGTADSEQREQAEARISSEFADKRSSFLRRLVDQEASQRAQLGYDFASDQQDLGMKQWQMMQQQAQQQFENDLALLKQRRSGSGSGYSQEDINNWLDEQAQMSVDYDGNAPFAREAIARRASKMFGGTPQNYINFFPDQWESGYTARPKISYQRDPMTMELVPYANGQPLNGGGSWGGG